MKPSTKKVLTGAVWTFIIGCCFIFAGLALGGASNVTESISIGGSEGLYLGNGALSIGGMDGIYIGNGVLSIGGADGIYIGNGTLSIGGVDGLNLGSGSRHIVQIIDETSITEVLPSSESGTAGVVFDDTFRSIEVNISVGEIIITRSGNQFSVATNDISNNNCFIENKGDTLYIGDNGNTNSEAKNPQIIISIPVGVNLKELSLYTKCGNITANALDSVTEKALLNTDLGDICWSGTTKKLTAVSSLGDITLSVPVDIQTISYDLSTSLGEVSVNARTYGDNARYENIEAPSCSVYANSSLGNVSLITKP